MNKKALLALMLALTMLLSGCTLLVKDQEVDNATEIVRLGDTVYTKGEVNARVDSYLQEEAYFYSMYGAQFDITDPEVIQEAREFVVQDLKETIVKDQKIADLGLGELTDEDQVTLNERIEEELNGYRDTIKAYYITDETLEGDALEAEVDKMMEELGIDDSALCEAIKDEIFQNKLRTEVVKDVAVSEEEIAADFAAKVENSKTTYAENAGSWASAKNNGSTLYYTPEGVRMVKQILIAYTDEDQKVLDELSDRLSETAVAASTANNMLTSMGVEDVDSLLAQANVTVAPAEDADGIWTGELTANLDAVAFTDAELDETVKSSVTDLATANAKTAFYQQQMEQAQTAALANIEAEADDVLAQLAAGGDWDALMAEKNDDPGMKSGATAENGYAVAAGMTSFDPAFVEAAMALSNVGDVSDKIVGKDYGYYIIKYVADAPAGEIALDEVRESISSTLLTQKQTEAFDTAVSSWVSEANFTINMNGLN